MGFDGPEVFWIGAGVDAGDYDANGAGADVGESVFGFEVFGDGADEGSGRVGKGVSGVLTRC